MINLIVPAEFTLGGIYLPPLLIVAIFGIIAASITAKLLNHYRLSRYFFYPPLAYVAIIIIYTLIFGSVLLLI